MVRVVLIKEHSDNTRRWWSLWWRWWLWWWQLPRRSRWRRKSWWGWERWRKWQIWQQVSACPSFWHHALCNWKSHQASCKNNKDPTVLGRLAGNPTYSWIDRRKSGEKRIRLWLKFSEKGVRARLRKRKSCASREECDRKIGFWKGIRRNRNTNTFRCKIEVQLGNTCNKPTSWLDLNNLHPLIASFKSFKVLPVIWTQHTLPAATL